jgi:hypothetical protein
VEEAGEAVAEAGEVVAEAAKAVAEAAEAAAEEAAEAVEAVEAAAVPTIHCHVCRTLHLLALTVAMATAMAMAKSRGVRSGLQPASHAVCSIRPFLGHAA